jgi:ribonuclease HI
MAKQLKGEYTVKNPTLKQLWQKVKALEKNFRKITYVNVPRSQSQIQEADKLVNISLDKEKQRLSK